MKRKLLKNSLKQTALAVPAAALMLGAAQAGTTVGLNFQAWYYDSTTWPQTIGYGAGYQTTGFPVTARAFGVDAANWFNTDPLPCQAAMDSTSTLFGSTGNLTGGSNTFAGSLTLTVTAPNAWQSGIGSQQHGWVPETVAPGNNEVTWGYLDDGNATGRNPTAAISGLSSRFPNGYVIQTFAANGGTPTFNNVDITDGITTNVLAYSNIFIPDPVDSSYNGAIGVSAPSGVFTADAIQINPEPKTAGHRSVLCGFIITDQPVVSTSPVGGNINSGGTISLSSQAIGILPISYQWYTNGVPIPGATSSNYTKVGATSTDSAAYTLVASNPYGSGTSVVAQVTVLRSPTIVVDVPASATNYLTLNERFSVVAGGQEPLSYQWYKGNSPIANATTASLNLTNVQGSDAANYKVVVTNSVDSITSGVTALTVLNSQPPYEGFNYTDGSLTGQGGGIGWSGPWTLEAGYNGDHSVFSPVTPWRGGLAELVSSGGAVQMGANGSADFEDIRNLQATLGGSSAGTLYISFVCQVTNAGWGGVELVQDGTSSLFLGSCWYFSAWGWGNRAAPDATTPVPASTLALLVYRFDFTPTNTAVRLYVNPSSLSAEPATADATGNEPLIAFDQLRIVTHNANPNGIFDEFRIGGTWAAVTPHVLRTDVPFTLQIVPGGLIRDTKPVGVPHPGYNHGSTWLASFTDSAPTPVTRTGVEQFSAAAGYQITVPTNADFNSPSGTICFWMLAGAPIPGPGNEAAMLVDRRTTTGAIIALNDAGAIYWQGQAGSRNSVTGGYLPDSNWHHVAVTYGQTTSDNISIYVDGVLAASTPVTNAWSWPLTQELEIGRSHDNYWKRYDGLMDDFRMYNRVLSDSEVAQIYANGALVDTSALVAKYNFDSAIYGQSVVWPYGTLQSTPVLGAGATWTPVPGATSPMPFLPSQPALFYRLVGTP
jgi:hypothetical protein